MPNRTPSSANGGNPIPDFTPVVRERQRHDGWTPDRQHAFIDALATTGSVSDASKCVNMAPEGAYALKRADTVGEFAAAWDAALDFGVGTLSDLAIDRIRHGTPVPVFWKGEQVGERRNYNERLHMLMLRQRLPRLYGPPQPGTATNPTQEQKNRWLTEWAEENEAKAQVWIDSFTTNIDRVRGAILRRCAANPDLQLAWELLCGETDWSRVDGWQPGEPTQFVRDNMTCTSTHIMLAQRLDEGSDATIGDLIFGAEDREENGTLDTTQ